MHQRILETLIDLNAESYFPLSQLILKPFSYSHVSYFDSQGKSIGTTIDLSNALIFEANQLHLQQTKEHIVHQSLHLLCKYFSSPSILQSLSLPELLLPVNSLLDSFVKNCQVVKLQKVV